MKEQGYGKGYVYPHDVEGAVAEANYFPVGVSPQSLYEPSDRGFEVEVSDRMSRVRRILRNS
jgi:putative ATPase